MNREELNKRKGFISVTLEFLNKTDFDVLSDMFSRFIPYQSISKNEFGIGIQKIYGVSPDFEPIVEGEMIPQYTVKFTTEYKKVEFIKC